MPVELEQAWLDAEARITELEECLRPFAVAADDLDDSHRDAQDIWEASAAMGITAGDLRRARGMITNKASRAE